MLVTDRLVVLRLRKCATAQMVTTVQAVVGGEFRKTLELGRSVPNSHGRIDFPLEGRRVLGTVRDPWSWYVSLWAYGCAGQGGLHARVTQHSSPRQVLGAMWRESRATRGLPRASVARYRAMPRRSDGWEDLYADSDDVDAFRAWLDRILDPAYAGLVEPWYGATAMPASMGLLTYRYLALFARDTEPLVRTRGFGSAEEIRRYDAEQNMCDEIIRTDRIAAELRGVFDRAGYELDAHQEAVLAGHTHDAPRRNRSEHRPWIDYHDARTLQLVAERDRLVVERFGYAIPEPVA